MFNWLSMPPALPRRKTVRLRVTRRRDVGPGGACCRRVHPIRAFARTHAGTLQTCSKPSCCPRSLRLVAAALARIPTPAVDERAHKPCCPDIVEDLAVVLRRVAHMIAPHQLVPTVHVDMVLVTVMALAVLLGPPRLDILLAPLCRPLSSQPAGVSPARLSARSPRGCCAVWVPPQSRRR